jgi:fructose 1,6-bisphosphatase
MKKGYRKYKTSDVLLVSRFQWTRADAAELGKRLRKFVIYLPSEVDNFSKCLNTMSFTQLKALLKQLNNKLNEKKSD